MKQFALAAMVVVAIAMVATPAGARNDPKHIPLPASPVDLDASYCGFPIHIDQVFAREYATVSTLEDGTTILHVTGSLRDTISSPRTTLTLDSSGPADVTIAPDGATTIVGRGHGVQPFTPEQQDETGLPGLVLFTGLTVLHFGADGSASLELSSGVVDLCERLA